MCLDKDILYKGNKVYSPNTCVFVPHDINLLFVKCDKSRGKYPVGVTYDIKNNVYIANCNNGNKCSYLGSFKNYEHAFCKYKEFKELRIKYVADKYQNKIPEKLYNAMYNWLVEITD